MEGRANQAAQSWGDTENLMRHLWLLPRWLLPDSDVPQVTTLTNTPVDSHSWFSHRRRGALTMKERTVKSGVFHVSWLLWRREPLKTDLSFCARAGYQYRITDIRRRGRGGVHRQPWRKNALTAKKTRFAFLSCLPSFKNVLSWILQSLNAYIPSL